MPWTYAWRQNHPAAAPLQGTCTPSGEDLHASDGGGDIWNDTPYNVERAPDGPGAHHRGKSMSSAEEQKGRTALSWVYLGIVGGLAACVVYPLLAFASLPRLVTVVLAALFAPALATASIGLHHFLVLHRESVASQLGTVFNLLAAALVSSMFFVQLAVRMGAGNGHAAPGLVGVSLGLDVAWDVFVSLGTFCFAVAAHRHPRLGLLFSIPGLLVALALLALNLGTFPTPPAEAGLIDLGPALGLWYLAVTLRMIGSLRWARGAIFGDR